MLAKVVDIGEENTNRRKVDFMILAIVMYLYIDEEILKDVDVKHS